MLMVLKPGREAEAEKIFRKWELDFAVIGEVTDTGHMVLEFNGEVVCDIPLGPLADDAPEYDRPHMSLDEYKAWAQVKPLEDVPVSTDIAADLLKLMGSPNLASRRWVYEQYDQSVGADTVLRPGGDAAVVRVHGSKKALAITTDCTPRYVYADPYEGGKQAIAEAYRNLCAVGARPLAVTNCLNFGNPQRPEIMAQFVEALRGMGDACRALDFPIGSGNVSLYNESKATGGGSAILPTPAIGGVGLLDDWENSATPAFKAEDEHILLISINSAADSLGQSLWLKEICGRRDGRPPSVNLTAERHYGEAVRKHLAAGLFTALHDISDGGMLVALTEMALAGNMGARVRLPILGTKSGRIERCFGEGQCSYLATISPRVFDGVRFDGCENIGEFLSHYQDLGTTSEVIGITGGRDIVVNELAPAKYGSRFARGLETELARIPLTDLRAAHEGFFPKLMGGELTPDI
jgi:phosphoribosylformylglycinamidine synthase